MKEKYSTTRLNLEWLRRTDYPFVRTIVNTPGWIRFIGDRHVHSDEDAQAYIERILSNPAIHYWVVRETESGASIGIISFIKRTYLDHHDIGFAFLPQYQGKGYAFEASEVVLKAVMQLPAHTKVVATTIPDNISSIRLLKKLGLHFEKEMEAEGLTLHLYAVSRP